MLLKPEDGVHDKDIRGDLLEEITLEERVIDRYDHPKWIWETILEKTGLERAD